MEHFNREEIKYLIENYGSLSILQLSKDINKNVEDIKDKLSKLHLYNKRNRKNDWSKDEIKILRENVGKLTHIEISKLINRSRGAISAKALKLGLNSRKDICKKSNVWTKKDIEFLKKNYNVLSIKELCNILNRSSRGIKIKAFRLNLKVKKYWNKKEEQFLLENYKQFNNVQLSKILSRSITSIKKKKHRMNLDIKNRPSITLPEAYISEILENNNLNYIFQYKIGKYTADFYIKNFNTVVEVLGDYWHANPKLYKSLRGFQKEKIERDRVREKYIKEQGYTIISIWEDDIMNNYDNVVIYIKQIFNII